jgi:hypothetical protein
MTRWKKKVMKKVRLEWEINYRNTMTDIQEAVVRRPNLLEKHLGRVQGEEDQFQQYTIGIPTALVSETDVDLLLWWDRSAFQQLRQMAFHLESIPAMSAEVERVFSSAKMLVTPERSSLSKRVNRSHPALAVLVGERDSSTVSSFSLTPSSYPIRHSCLRNRCRYRYHLAIPAAAVLISMLSRYR